MFDPVDAVNSYYHIKYRIRELFLYKYPSMYLQNTQIFSKNDSNVIIQKFRGIRFEKVTKPVLINSENENVKQDESLTSSLLLANIIIPTENVNNDRYKKSKKKLSKNDYYRRNRNNQQQFELHKKNIKNKYNKKLNKLLKTENRMTKSINNDDLLYYVYHDIPNIVTYYDGFCYINNDYCDQHGDFIEQNEYDDCYDDCYEEYNYRGYYYDEYY